MSISWNVFLSSCADLYFPRLERFRSFLNLYVKEYIHTHTHTHKTFPNGIFVEFVGSVLPSKSVGRLSQSFIDCILYYIIYEKIKISTERTVPQFVPPTEAFQSWRIGAIHSVSLLRERNGKHI